MSAVTHVFGQGAREYRDANFPQAAVWEEPTLNPKVGAPGSEASPRHILVLPGEYDLASGYLGGRADVTVRGLDRRATFKNTDIAADYALRFLVSDLTLKNSAVSLAHWHASGRQDFTVQRSKFCAWTQNKNGIVNPNGKTLGDQITRVLDNEFDGVGSADNTRHVMYLEGRPLAKLEAHRNWFRGARKCSQIKTTFVHNDIRDNRFDTFDSTGLWAAHTMIDVPACSRSVVVGNRFNMWAQKFPYRGLFTAAIFWRDRKPGMLGAEFPPYGSAAYLDPETWADAFDAYNDPESPLLFQKYVYRNDFQIEPGSIPLGWLRDDGTYPLEALEQLQTGARAKSVPIGWIERSITHESMNTFGPGVIVEPKLDDNELVVEIEPGALWPRPAAVHYPRVKRVEPVITYTLPEWFTEKVA